MDALRLIRTARHLRPVQIWGRLAEPLPRPAPRSTGSPLRRPTAGAWAPPIARDDPFQGPDRLRFLNEDADVSGASAWRDRSRSHLWLYNLHYFDALTSATDAEGRRRRARLLARWIAENPIGGGPGWEPYPVSLRIVNWIKWSLAGAPFGPDWLASLAAQARWLERRIEWRLLGNHLIANAKALIFVGLYFEGPEAERWRLHGLRLLGGQLHEQLLADGGHFERSPMYHAIILEDLLDLINLAGAMGQGGREVADWIAASRAMRRWLRVMSHPDGEIGFFNDAAFGIAAPLAALEAYAARLGLPPVSDNLAPLEALTASGYVRIAAGDAAALLDVAPVGPDCQPGHAHADTLSFELSLGAERLIVNGGVSAYGADARRQQERATRSHSTVEVAGGNSSEVWAGFRVGRRARPFDLQMGEADDLAVSCAHDGYRHLRGSPVHRRGWRMTPNSLAITDGIEGGRACAVARHHLGPGVKAEAGADWRSGRIVTPGGRSITWRASEPVTIQASEWRPRFGERMATQQLVFPVGRRPLNVVLSW